MEVAARDSDQQRGGYDIPRNVGVSGTGCDGGVGDALYHWCLALLPSTSHRRKDFWYNIGDLIREEGITLMRGDVLVFVARSDSRHILFEDGEQMI